MQVARQLYEIVLIYSKSHRKQAGVCLFKKKTRTYFSHYHVQVPKIWSKTDITFHNMGSCYSSFILKWIKLIFQYNTP